MVVILFRSCFIFLFLSLLFFSSTLLTYSQAARQKDASVVAVNELSDVEGNEWAYKAVQELVEKYDVLEGYPDGTYKGQSPSTRFELAAAVYDLATYFSDEIATNREDLAKLAKLLDEFSSDVKNIQGRVEQLETTVMSVEGRTQVLEGQIAQHQVQLQEHEKRLAYAERKKGFLLERLAKGLVVDFRNLSRGIFSTLIYPFNRSLYSSNNASSQ